MPALGDASTNLLPTSSKRQKYVTKSKTKCHKDSPELSMGNEAEAEPIAVLELFSGIGGMHFALREAGVPNAEVAAALDINDVANKVYKHNFPQTNHVAGNICGLTAEK